VRCGLGEVVVEVSWEVGYWRRMTTLLFVWPSDTSKRCLLDLCFKLLMSSIIASEEGCRLWSLNLGSSRTGFFVVVPGACCTVSFLRSVLSIIARIWSIRVPHVVVVVVDDDEDQRVSTLLYAAGSIEYILAQLRHRHLSFFLSLSLSCVLRFPRRCWKCFFSFFSLS
jgi:hypothetical protein